MFRPKKKIGTLFQIFLRSESSFPGNSGFFQRLVVIYFTHSLWEMILLAQIYNKFNFRPNIPRFSRESRWQRQRRGFPRRGGEGGRGQMPQLEWLSHYMAPKQWTQAMAPWNFKSNLSEIYFSFETISGSFWSSKLKKKSKKSVSLEY